MNRQNIKWTSLGQVLLKHHGLLFFFYVHYTGQSKKYDRISGTKWMSSKAFEGVWCKLSNSLETSSLCDCVDKQVSNLFIDYILNMLLNELIPLRRVIFDGVLWIPSLLIPWSISSVIIWIKTVNGMLITFRGNMKVG